MKKLFCTLLIGITAMSLVTLNAQTIVLSESFEDGIPATWTQENMFGSQAWVVETGGTHPEKAFDGQKRAVLRNATDQTIGFKTRLITPVMDLIGVYQPILRFAHAQATRTGDFDTLRVWYRTDTKADWKILTEYTSAIPTWKVENVDLVGVTGSYQLAFEGTDNLGRGIVLDNIQVRSKPECTIPHDLYVTNMAEGAVTLGWLASLDANYFQIVLTKEQIDIDTLQRVPADLIARNDSMEADSVTYRIKNLDAGQYYWAYVRSLCDEEESDWGTCAFRMNPTVHIPYIETFNKDGKGLATRPVAWSFGNNMDTEVPFVSTNYVQGSPELAMYSNDGTYSMVFSGKNSDETAAVPAGFYEYAATPELIGENIRDCQVRFWTTVGTYTGRRNACALIVGVMTDPDDINTFVAIDTVSVYGNQTYKENIVSLASYKGTGRYVAFLSKFAKPNRIYMDNLVVEKRPAVGKVIDVRVDPRDTEATITWDKAFGATGYDILIATSEVDPVTATVGGTVLTKETTAANSFTIKGLTAGTNWSAPYFVYVRATNGSESSDWSYRMPFITTQTGTIPMSFSMNDHGDNTFTIGSIGNIKYPTEVSVFGNHGATDYLYPYLDASNPHDGTGAGNASLTSKLMNGEDAWVVFPRLSAEQLKGSQIKFYITNGNNPQDVHLALGVMTNPMDISTFTQVAEFYSATELYTRCGASFADYTGNGEYIAIRWLDSKTEHSNASIDDITIDAIAMCQAPSGMGANVSEASATLDWSAGGAQNWQIMVTNAFLGDDVLENMGDPVAAQTTNPAILKVANVSVTPRYDMEGLTPSSTYYYYVRTECNTDYSEWSSVYAFTTACPAVQPTPYTETFSNYGTGNTAFPTCWTSNFDFGYDAAHNHYPYIAGQGINNGSEISLYFYESIDGITHTTNYSSVAVAPKLDIPVKETRIRFRMRATGTVPLIIGAISNPNDYSTFEPIETVHPTNTRNWNTIIVDLKKYSGSAEYIAFSTRNTGAKSSYQCYIDDVTFASSRCAQPFDIHASHAGETELTIAWGGVTDDKWQVILSSEEGHFDGDQLTGTKNIKDTIVVANEVTIGGLQSATPYYVYVRPTCGLQEWNGTMLQTECMCINPRVPYRENFDSYGTGKGTYPHCWTCSNADVADNTYFPYVSGNSDYAVSRPNVLYFHTSGVHNPSWGATPKIDVDDMNGIMVSFSGTYYTEDSYLFGVMSDPNDISTFVMIDSIPTTITPTLHYYDLSDYVDIIGDAKYIVWVTPRDGNIHGLYLDEVIVTKSTCPTPNPVISRVTHNSARLASGLRVSNPWRVILTNKELDVEKLDAGNFSIPGGVKVIKDTTFSASTRGFIFNNLQEETDYYCAVAAVCDDKTSAWYSMHFTTTCHPLSIDALGTIGFEDSEGYVGKLMPCWTCGNKSYSMGSNIPSVDRSGDYAYTGNNALKMHSTTPADNSGFTNGAYAIMPAIDVEDITSLQVNFYARAEPNTSAYKITVGVITDPADLATFVPVRTVDLTDNYSGYSVLFRGYEGDYLGQMGSFIAFMSQFDKKNGVYIDDISVGPAPSCPMPQSVTAELVSEDAVEVTWLGFSDKYRVVLAYDEVAAKDLETYNKFVFDTIVDKTNMVRFSGLKLGTQYFAYVQGICSASEKSPFSTSRVWVKTSCPERVEVPYTCDFDHNASYGQGVMPDCWTGAFLGSAHKNYPAVMAEARRGDKGCGLELYAIGVARTIAILPDLFTDDLSQYMLSFHARKAAAGHSFMVGYLTDLTDMDRTFHAIDTIETTSNFHKFYVDLAPYQKELIGARLAFMINLDIDSVDVNDIYVDNVSVAPAPTCKPAEVVDVTSTKTTAEVSIYSTDPSQSKWQVAVVEAGKFTGEDNLEKDAVIKTITGTTASFTGLTAGIKYYAYVRAVCSETDKSDWSDQAYAFYTAITYADSYFFGFEKSEGWLRAVDAESDVCYLHPTLKTGALVTNDFRYRGYAQENDQAGTYAHTGVGALNLTADAEDGAYVIFPAIDNPKARSFSFDVRPGFANAGNTSMSRVYYQSKFVLGSVAKGQGIETFEEIASVILPNYQTTSSVNSLNDYLYQSYTFNFDENFMRDRQIVLMNKVGATILTFDNVRLDAPKSFSTPVYKSIFAADTYVDIEFVSSDNKTVYLMPGSDVDMFDLNGTGLLTFGNITGSAHLTGLEPYTNYILRVVENGAPADAEHMTYFTRVIRTQCTPKEWTNGKLIYTFDDGDLADINQPYPYTWADYDMCYQLPSCWQNGGADMSVKFQGWIVVDPNYSLGSYPPSKLKKKTCIYGMNGTNALYCTDMGSSANPWVSMSYVNCDFDTTQLTFYARTMYEDIETHKVPSLTGAAMAYNGHIVVGTCEEQNDITTFTPIDTIYYDRGATSATLFNADPKGLDYWQKFTLPLKGAKGRFITFRSIEKNTFFIDNVTFEKATGIIAPKGVSVEFGATTANVTWQKEWHPECMTIVSVYAKDQITLIQSDTIAPGIMHYEFHNLEPGTRYAINVAQTNGEKTSEPDFVEIFTDCMPLTLSYTCSFENAQGVRPIEGGASSAIIQANCWTFGNSGTSFSKNTSYPYVIVNETSKKYSHTGTNAVRLYAQATSTTAEPLFEDYIVSSAFDGDLDTVQLEFWALPAYRNGSNVITYVTAVGSDYSKAVEVGTCTDPNDKNTFSPIRICQYSKTTIKKNIVGNAANDYWFERFVVPLKGAVGPYVYIRATQYMADGTKKLRSEMYVDDIAFSHFANCPIPLNVHQTAATVNSVTIEWVADADKFVVQTVRKDGDGETVVSTNNVTETNDVHRYEITGLDPSSTYYVRVQTVCSSSSKSDWSNDLEVRTYLAPYWKETLGNNALKDEWMTANTYASDLFGDKSGSKVLDGENNTTYGWRFIRNTCGLVGAHYGVPFYSAQTHDMYNYYWMVTPSITLNSTDSVHLTFNLALTANVSGESAPDNKPFTETILPDQAFMVIISEDNGRTWRRENATVWMENSAADYLLSSIPFDGKLFAVDLSKYMGKTIKIAFYKQSSTFSRDVPFLHINDVRVNKFAQILYEDDNVCQFTDVEANGLYISGDAAKMGLNVAQRFTIAEDPEQGQPESDKVYTIRATYVPASQVNMSASFCEGSTYADYGFTPVTKGGVYRRKLQSVAGCDSIVTLQLTGIPVPVITEEANICQGETYTWRGRTLSRSGIYGDTLKSAVTGCDSIQRLVLTYFNSEDTLTKSVTIAQEDLPYTYESITYPVGTKPGVYVDMIMVQGTTCSAVMVHTLTITAASDLEKVDVDELHRMMYDGEAHKFIYRDRLYILRDAQWYDAIGQKVGSPLW